jgi:hypothetical protein
MSEFHAGVGLFLIRFRFFFEEIPQNILERSFGTKAILDTSEPSSDRLTEEGRPLLRRLSFYFALKEVGLAARVGHPAMTNFGQYYTRSRGNGVLPLKAQRELGCRLRLASSPILYAGED